MLSLQWHSVDITTNHQANEMIKLIRTLKPKIGAIDTETTGLHIISATPFLFQCGFIHPNMKEGYTFVVDLERQPLLAKAVIQAWNTLAKDFDLILGHNIKFDLHMLINAGLPYLHENVSDTMFYIRYAHDALAPKNGGVPLGLKEYTARFIDPNAKYHEHLIRHEQSAIAKELNLRLKMRLRECGAPPARYGGKSYTLTILQDIFKDATVDVQDLPEAIQSEYLAWLQHDIPIYLQNKVTGLVTKDMIPYNLLNRKNIIAYAHKDIIYTLEIYLQLHDTVRLRENEIGLQIENSLIFPLLEMERVGFKTDKAYLKECRQKMKTYIRQRRQKLYDLAGRELKINQHELIKRILTEDFGVEVQSTSTEELDRLRNTLIRQHTNPEVVEFIEVVQELRTLEKWYSTYILRFLQDLQQTDRLYTTINQVGTISGRVTSDFQQFPKHPITTIDGEELFHPRKMIIPTGGDYDAIVYLDYSQIELRFQAFYTILVGDPDLNLCRAYMPYRCHKKDGTKFDFTNITHITAWNQEWYLDEDPEIQWTPTDVHGVMATTISGLTPEDEGFDEIRQIGKRTNFAKNYGATRRRIREMFPEKSEAEITKIDSAYYKAFPGVETYHQYCKDRANNYSYTTNLFGIKYYNVSGHKLINLLIQGSAAYYLKLKIRELYDYCKANNIKTRWQMQVHDDLSWERHKADPLNVFFDFKQIMETWPDTYVPVVAEMECTTTTWANKQKVETLDDLRLYLST